MKVQLTDEGQITIPLEIREQLGLEGGDELFFSIKGTEIKLQVIKPKRLSQFYGILPATKPYPGKEIIRTEVANTLAGQISTETE